MRKILVRNFGPINNGTTDSNGWIDFKKITVFIGNNGTGKSTVTKLLSMLSWLEKALFQGRYSEKEINRKGWFQRFARYHKIDEYFRDDTEIAYEGDAFSIIYYQDRLDSHKKQSKAESYKVPKIMYVPSERNFLSVASNPEKIKGLPESLGTFLDEYEIALQQINGRLLLPLGGIELSYQKQNKIAYVHGQNDTFRLRLSDASSGIQAAAPLFLVSRHLVNSLEEKKEDFTRKRSSEEERAFKQEISRIIENPRLPEDVKTTMLELLSGRYSAALFLNIVEEPEQNLFPDSQRNILNSLVKFTNMNSSNELIFTTHSPYLVNYLSLSIKAGKVLSQLRSNKYDSEKIRSVENIVPELSALLPEEVVIYEVKMDGTIKRLNSYEGIPSDENDLNEHLMEINELFSELVEIRQEA